MAKADLVVSHAGAGSIMEALGKHISRTNGSAQREIPPKALFRAFFARVIDRETYFDHNEKLGFILRDALDF